MASFIGVCVCVCWQGRSVQHTERRARDRSRERNSRRSSSPDSPPSPPLPDITVPFYMLPRSDEPELSIPSTSRPQLVSYPTPHLTNAARVPLISYPLPQSHGSSSDNPAPPDTVLPQQHHQHQPPPHSSSVHLSLSTLSVYVVRKQQIA